MTDHLIHNLLKYRAIPVAQQEQITQAFSLQHYKAGEWLLPAGKIARQLFFINAGVLKITVPHPAADDTVYYFMKSHQFITLLYSMYGNVPGQQGLQAASDLEVRCIGYEALLALYATLPYLRSLIDEIAQLTMAEMVTVKNAYIAGDARAKYQHFLATEPEVAAKVPLKDIASYLGIQPPSLSRIRRSLMGR